LAANARRYASAADADSVFDNASSVMSSQRPIVSSPVPGSFEYLEARIRRDATGTLFGQDFEWICQWYLEHAPLYRGKFRKIWRWKDWPERWGPDCGIDLIAETHDGKLWAIQAKAVASEHSITKSDVNSFLSETNRRQIDYRLLIATTDELGDNARRTIDQQEKRVSFVGRGDLLAGDIIWPTVVGGKAPRPPRAKPKPHQRAAVTATLRGFRKHDRGRLIMACGTGKTLTGLWIHERLESRRTLLLVPSISLVQQNLREWGRHAKDDFDCLVVCSDESVANDRHDPALRFIAELGIDVTTDAADIATFLAKRRRRPAVVISTYQSSDRVAAGQRRVRKSFDLALCDEAHRLVGDVGGKFATVLDDRKIRCRRRLFMTATPRYFTDRARKKAADLDLEVASMDDIDTFGPEFHVLKFSDAISAKPDPLLTDYRVVVIGVTDAEVAAWVKEGKLVRTKEGAETDARTLAAQIGLAKAMREYDLRRVITFHRSIRRAARFVDADRPDSLPAIMEKLRLGSRPSGPLWARHISGETPASKRASMLRALAEQPAGTRGLISNCACLGEGVDVPALDGIAFIDPKGSIVDIIQAVGRVIRLSPDKTVGTIVIPVFIDESGDAEDALDQSSFAPVWQVLRALRAHDQRLADELDAIRTSRGMSQRGGHVELPQQVILNVPRLLLKDFEEAFYVRAVERITERPPLTIEQILKWADEHKSATGEWPQRAEPASPGGDPCEKWANVDASLKNGTRGLRGGSSLARLLHELRHAVYVKDASRLSVTQILRWADDHYAAHGTWPKKNSGPIQGTAELWVRLDRCLILGRRGLPGRSSLAAILQEHRGVRNSARLPALSHKQILKWADEYHRRHGVWPTHQSGPVESTNETWQRVANSMWRGTRGLPVLSLADLLHQHRGHRNVQNRPCLTVAQVLKWAETHKERTGKWPRHISGPIPGTDESWSGIESALQRGRRGLPGDMSIAQLLTKHRSHRNRKSLGRLTVKQILKWADAHHAAAGEWPKAKTGAIPATGESWGSIDMMLWRGGRGLPGGDSLARLLATHRGYRNPAALAPLTILEILKWAEEWRRRNGRLPRITSGEIPGSQDSWESVNRALIKGLRGLAGGSSLAKLLDEHARR
jgi:superfamily II DNA or RNA helicase